jgi:hypothetical protein
LADTLGSEAAVDPDDSTKVVLSGAVTVAATETVSVPAGVTLVVPDSTTLTVAGTGTLNVAGDIKVLGTLILEDGALGNLDGTITIKSGGVTYEQHLLM